MKPGAIASVQADSPASAAKLKAGDRIVSVDGEPLGNPLTIDDRLKQRSGEVVLLGVLRTDAVHNASGELVPETIEEEMKLCTLCQRNFKKTQND